eukprot:TRINITY_DN52644_c0_g1_i1.p2 TRINITY_DN52644_c0_g1~~TRINITY_DN52644_c0_g1_i1.p2  ORF type:complete len:138 (-),score=14.49 TRINITY_DN52644_c0_g1_i1:39-452(-)
MQNSLSGTIPSQSSELTALESLLLYQNLLSGTISPGLSSMTRLYTLYLYENPLRGTVPPELSSLTNLELFAVVKSHLSGTIPAALGTLTNLRDLGLDNNSCLLYTSDAADEEDSVDLGGRRLITDKITYIQTRGRLS